MSPLGIEGSFRKVDSSFFSRILGGPAEELKRGRFDEKWKIYFFEAAKGVRASERRSQPAEEAGFLEPRAPKSRNPEWKSGLE